MARRTAGLRRKRSRDAFSFARRVPVGCPGRAAADEAQVRQLIAVIELALAEIKHIAGAR